MRAGLTATLAIALLVAGCATPGTHEPAPPGARAPDEPAPECPPLASQPVLRDLRARGDTTPTDHAPGTIRQADELARHGAPAIAWTWQQVAPGEAADHLHRIGDFTLQRIQPGDYALCGEVSLSAQAPPQAVEEAHTLKVVIEGAEPLTPGNYTVVIHWSLGGIPDGHRNGNSTATLTVT